MAETFDKLLKNGNFIEKVFEEMVKENYGNVREIFKQKGVEVTSDQIEELKRLYSEVYNQVSQLPESEIEKINAGLGLLSNEFTNANPEEIEDVLHKTSGITNLSDEQMADAAGGLKLSLEGISGLIGAASNTVLDYCKNNKCGSTLAFVAGTTGVGIGLKNICDGNYVKGVGQAITGLGAAGAIVFASRYIGEKKVDPLKPAEEDVNDS
ncbi:MAG: hypothetical protein FWC41_04970 [Firmicutes bacterium]|nr:hypothetical protein [Bacillota bacterium]